MLDTAGDLALLPEYRFFVFVSVAAYVVVFALAEKFSRSDRVRRIIEVITTAAFIMFCMAWSAHNDNRQALDRIDRIVMFRNDRHAISDASGRIVGRLCLNRIFNVSDAVSVEREAIVVSYGRSCQ